MLQPGDCSPSRKVVSKMVMRRDVINAPPFLERALYRDLASSQSNMRAATHRVSAGHGEARKTVDGSGVGGDPCVVSEAAVQEV
jgi:hypothetical protein